MKPTEKIYYTVTYPHYDCFIYGRNGNQLYEILLGSKEQYVIYLN